MKALTRPSGGLTGTDETTFVDDTREVGEVDLAATPKRAVLYLRVSTSRQATKNGEAEGYSIPAQRSACERKVAELGGEVVAEFIDAGASARSADRAGLQELLAYVAGGGVDYVLVHKLDRLARDRADDVAIVLAIRKAGAILVSASEQIDETPSGMLMHGIMATMAEFYSRNLANEAKKGIAQKAKNGGTHGVAPLGYLNTLARIDGREVKGVAIEEDKATHIRWAFGAYATGEWSISQLRDELEERGLKSRTTQTFVGTPLNNSQVHRMLTNPYYVGRIQHLGVIYDGAHEALVDEATWYQVQEVLAGRRIAGDRSWRHSRYLKGTLVCGRCGGRMGFGHAKGKGGIYHYFFCLGRHTGRTDCDLPYISVEKVEAEIEKVWATRVKFKPQEVERAAQLCREELDALRLHDQALLTSQTQRLTRLERQKQKLIDAYLIEAIPVDDLKQRQAGIMTEMNDAKRLIETCQNNMALMHERLDLIFELFNHADQLWKIADDQQRKLLNQAYFSQIRVMMSGDDDPHRSQQTMTCQLAGELAEPVVEVAKLVRAAETEAKTPHTAVRRARGAKSRRTADNQSGEHNETPSALSLAGGFNVNQMAETEGFEPV